MTGHRSIQETGFSPGIFPPIFLPRIQLGSERVSHGIPTRGRRVAAVSFSDGFAARLPERRLTKGLLARCCRSLVFKPCRGQRCCSCPETRCPGLPALAKHPRIPARAWVPAATAVWGSPGATHPLGRAFLLRGRWWTAASSAPASSSEPASPGGTGLGRRGSGQALAEGLSSGVQPSSLR